MEAPACASSVRLARNCNSITAVFLLLFGVLSPGSLASTHTPRADVSAVIGDSHAAQSTCNGNTEISCDGGRACIPKNYVCDGIADCQDGADEPASCVAVRDRPCTIVEFRCANGRCIPLQYICDGRADCRDSSDENLLNCSNTCHKDRDFFCPANAKTSSCFPLTKQCDGVYDCIDGRDEIGCGDSGSPSTQCAATDFRCRDGACINKSKICNAFIDCEDGSDELGCGCDKEKEFACEDRSRCIFKEWRCDGSVDCLDGSDEKGCETKALKCQPDERLCGSKERLCVPLNKFCDGTFHCDDHSDEGPQCYNKQCTAHIDTCINGTCQPLPDGTLTCLCPAGYALDPEDSRTCIKKEGCPDTDGRSNPWLWGRCSQKCASLATGTGYVCDCYPGFKLAQDKFTCDSVDNRSAYLIFSSRHEIRMLNLREPDIQPVLVPSLRNTIAIDFLYDTGDGDRQQIFWTDVVDDKIFSGSLVDSAVFNIQTVVENSIPTAEGIAVDYVAKNLYWVESTLDQIEVSKLNGQRRGTIIAGSMHNPRAIALDPQEGWLFWSDWDPEFPRIERASMAGENRSVLVNVSSVKGGRWPNGLAMDLEMRPHRVYWIDAYSDAIYTVDIDGHDLREILRGGDFIQHPFALAVYGSHVFWTDWRTNAIHKANKWNGSNIETVVQVTTQPFDLHVMHSSLQPKVSNPCANQNGGCSHLCVIGLGGTARCVCPHLTKFVEGSTTQCQHFRTFMVFSASTEIRGVTLDASYHNFIPAVINVQNATSMEVDVQTDSVYWVETKAKTVVRGFLNGTSIETIIDSPGTPRPTDIAIDWISRNIYTTFSADYTAGKLSIASTSGEIVVSTLSGEFRKTLVKDGIKTPISVAVDSVTGAMVWADIGFAKHRIELSAMNGDARRVFIDEASSISGSKIAGARGVNFPRCLTFGYGKRQGFLYWISRVEEEIQFCRLPTLHAEATRGRCPQVEALSAVQLSNPLAIAYYDDSLLIALGHPQLSVGVLRLADMNFTVIRSNNLPVVSLKMFSPQVQTGSNACSERNGGCSQLCLPSFVSGRTCNCTVGYVFHSQDGQPTACMPINSTLLFSMGNQIHGISLDISQTEKLLPPLSRITLAAALDFEAENSYIYWVDPKLSTLNRIRRDLTGRQVILQEGITSVEDIALDWIAGNIYWTNPAGKSIEVARLNGSSRYVVVYDKVDQPKAIAVHPAKGYLFWSDNAATRPRIERAFLDGSGRFSLTLSGRITDMTVDYELGHIYWCDALAHLIGRANLDFSGRISLISAVEQSLPGSPSALAVFQQYLYWTDKNNQKGVIYRADKADLRSATVVRQDLNATVNDLVIFSKDRQKGSNPCAVNNGGCEELCFFIGNTLPESKSPSSVKSAGVQCACAHGLLAPDGQSCDIHSSFLLYSRGRSVESAPLTGELNKNDPLPPISNSSFMLNVIGLGFDFANSRLFYSDIQRGEIGSVFFNGTDFRIMASGIHSAEGLAFDSMTSNLYWTSYNNASIFRMSVGRSGRSSSPQRVIQLTVGDKLRNLALDACREMLYWTNWNKDRPSIQRAGFDGRQLEDIIDTDIKTPNAITIDHRSQYLFWADALLDKIERCRFDGRDRKVLLWENVRHPFALAVFGEHIYWTDWILRAIVRANKHTGLDVVKIREGLGRQPMGIVAVANSSQDCRMNPCFVNNGNCSDMCVPTENGTGVVCHCFNNATLLPNGTCDAGPMRCPPDQFKCPSNGQCIPLLLTCDSRRHCQDGADENVDYCKYRVCPVSAGFFACKTTRRCIPDNLRCNRRDECGDGSDERDCVCNESEFKCKTTGECIKNEYHCDGEQDCGDSSDEIGCAGKDCETTPDGRQMLPCPHSSMCYLPEWLCDGDNDCGDNFDEQNCTTAITAAPSMVCSNDWFRCSTGQGCIPPGWRCDGEPDCHDKSDELNCSSQCPPNSFQCSDGSCIPSVWKCDGVPECPGGSDEAVEVCQKTNCSDSEFRCLTSGLCIPADWRCDGDSDCGKNDTSDETEGCEGMSRCAMNEFRCRNNRCIPGEFICDGLNDCGDSTDEIKEMCDVRRIANTSAVTTDADSTQCAPAEFRCNNAKCLNESLVCDNADDCGDLSDEVGCDQDDCQSNPCGPHGVCIEKRIGYGCNCSQGYVMSNRSGQCVDENECLRFPCSHFCYNTIGSYRCVCAHNYTAIDSGRLCKASSDVTPNMLYTVRHSVRTVLLRGDTAQVGGRLLAGNLSSAVAVDFDWDSQCVFWSDVLPTGSTINRLCLNQHNASHLPEVKVLHSSSLSNPDGMAVDWIGKNLYWCDKGSDTIEVSNFDGGWRKILLKEGLHEPRALVVDPHHGYLYWSDWGTNAHIGKMAMDGGSPPFRLILDRTELFWPNALTIDYVTNTLFWADAHLDYIAMADLNLQNRRRIRSNSQSQTPTERLGHVFAMSVFEDFLYWTDWESKQIHRAHKFTGRNMTVLVSASSHRPMDLQVFHPFRQAALAFGPNPCAKGGGCSNLCLLKPTNSSQRPVGKVCACPESFALQRDMKTCAANCSQAQFVCLQTFKCIPKWWVCDGQDDCGDGSDEQVNGFNCGDRFGCTPGEFQCVDGKGCLHPTAICDGIKQCADGSDEDGSVVDCPSYRCLSSQFKCAQSNHCIPMSMRCDGRPDCRLGEDEANCTRNISGSLVPKHCMPPLRFQCGTGQCIGSEKVCDGVGDCTDSSDEMPAINCTMLPCGRNDSFRCANRQCIEEARRCDGINDCSDGSDEWPHACLLPGNCDTTSFFTCNNSRCISRKWVCDDEDDCGDNSDEAQCYEPEMNCGSNEVACDGHCIDAKFQCDGEADCQDGSDELNCTSPCAEGYTACRDGSGCVQAKWKCDGVIDCPDASDENNCAYTCAPDEHTCKNKRCITKTWLCDGDNDCGDGSDEEPGLCARFPCFADRFRCASGLCILPWQQCDGRKDCADGSDELYCPGHQCRYRCANGRCLQSEKVLCDGVDNCGDGSDEEACPDQENPCDRHGLCSQRCAWDNNGDSFNCICDGGYRMLMHGRNKTCVAEGAAAYLLVSEHSQLTRLDPYHRRADYRPLMAFKEERMTFMDVEILSGNDAVLYWSSRDNHGIFRQTVPKRRKERADFDHSKPMILVSNVVEPRGVAVDWVNKRLFWVDGHSKHIETALLNGSLRSPVVSSELSDPYNLVVDPESGYVFWSDVSGRPRIERARYDGSDRRVLAQASLRYPTGMAIDYANRRLYWADPKTGSVETITLEGRDRRSIKHSLFEKEKPYGIDVFEDELYVSTYSSHSVFKINKWGAGNATLLAKGLRRPARLLIVQEHKQNRQLPALCQSNPCEGQRVCVPEPPAGYKCVCPGYSIFNEQNRRCEATPGNCIPPCQNGGKCLQLLSGNGFVCRCSAEYSGPTCAVSKCATYCYNNGACYFDEQGNTTVPRCRCKMPFAGERCQSNLCSTHCKNNGTCSLGPDSQIHCQCLSGWSGQQCEKPVDQCDKLCKNGGRCFKGEDGRAYCQCDLGFTGDQCEWGEGPCGRCLNGGICYVDSTSGAEKCRCLEEFTGDRCEECQSFKCENDGTCHITGGKPRCNCSIGFTGQRCQKDLCQAYCASGNCIHGVPPRCNCPPGRSGLRCEVDENCACRHNATCGPLVKVDGRQVNKCICPPGFSGTLCEKALNCYALQCLNGAKCVKDEVTNFRCDCPVGWLGERCETHEKCVDYCENGGTCLPGAESDDPTCLCPSAFMGAQCQSTLSDVDAAEEAAKGEEGSAAVIVYPVMIVVLLLLLAVGLCVGWRRRQQAKAFRHILMEDMPEGGGGGMQAAISNPMYLKDGDDILDEQDVLHPDKAAFANPIYESHVFRGGGGGRPGNSDTEKAGLLLQDEELDVVGLAAVARGQPHRHALA
ncbi:prolow-density lipoprotein receptor-related protein 1-like [Paramacrobiotus metropolitanus]|uniref:prolow-density lipoprotein receptor-related protein 1-like n=1 Tax=Paramacrobiotus metropolitanus TaxID=2943436 RepID=UPI00244596F7|nr:prolow-density lipoprotein receptor-related protein 1-like [Paramacrobiotus metropolitanus]